MIKKTTSKPTIIRTKDGIIPENKPNETPKLWMCVISKKLVIFINWNKSM